MGWPRNAFPVMMYEPYEPVVFVLAGLLVKWAFRHRSIFAPFALCGLAFWGALVLRADDPHGWTLTLTVGTLVTVSLAVPHRWLRHTQAGILLARMLTRLWSSAGVDRPAERAYAACVTGTLTGWLSAAVLIGATTGVMPRIALIATVVLGIPWWAHRRRRARVRVLRTIQAWPSVAESVGLPGSRMTTAVVDAWGYTVNLLLRKGMTVADAIGRIPAIESGLGIRPGSVRVLADASRSDRCVLRVLETNPHEGPIAWRPPADASITKPVILGLFEDARDVTLSLVHRHVLIGGATGAGKSGVVNVIMGFLVACRDVVVWGIDMKGGMELQPWTSCLGKLATTDEQVRTLLRTALAELSRRTSMLAASGKRLWEPTPEKPALVIVIDEYAELSDDAKDMLDSIARLGRAVAVTIIAATQRPSQDAMGRGAVRSQMDVRICLHVRERRDTDLILGQGMFNAGWQPTRLVLPGSFLISSPEIEHQTPIPARACHATDQAVARQARDQAPHRPHLADPPPLQAAPSATQDSQTGQTGTNHADDAPEGSESPSEPETALWHELRNAGEVGASVSDLMRASGMSRPTLYRHLQRHENTGRVARTSRGRWRAVLPPSGPSTTRPAQRSRRERDAQRRIRRRPPNRDT